MMEQDGNTPLHIAAAYGHIQIASLLIGNGADINSKDVVSILLYIYVTIYDISSILI